MSTLPKMTSNQYNFNQNLSWNFLRHKQANSKMFLEKQRNCSRKKIMLKKEENQRKHTTQF